MISELRGEGVGVKADSRFILRGVDIAVRSGEVVAVTGPSGSGKTTLLLALAGLQPLTEGRVLLDQRPIPEGDEVRRLFGVVLQNHGLVSVLTATENAALPLQARRMPPPEIERRCREALAAVGLAANADHLVQDLSGGQQQRAAVARALAGDPDILIADEPTSELVKEQRETVLKLLVDQARRGRIVVIASHDPEVVETCDRSLRLVDGQPLLAGAA